MTNPKIYEDVEQWESRQLGADEAYVKKISHHRRRNRRSIRAETYFHPFAAGHD